MYLLTSTCPQCGAPIFLLTAQPNGDGVIVDLQSGLWTMAPVPTFTCECRLHLFPTSAPPKGARRLAPSDPIQRANERAAHGAAFGTRERG